MFASQYERMITRYYRSRI